MKRAIDKTLLKAVSIALLLILTACNIQTGKSHFVLAERLFNNRKYQAAIQEFKKVVESDPKSDISQQALFRIATIQYLYISEYAEAVKTFRQFSFISQDTRAVYESEKNIGEILFSKLEDYRGALEQYQRLLGKYPDARDKDLFYFRLAKSNYFSLKFEDAIKYFKKLVNEMPQSPLVEESYYNIGNSYYTSGDYDAALEAFEDVLSKFPKGTHSVFAVFGLASCYAEMDQLEEAYNLFNKIKDLYPSKNVVELKIKSVQERREKRNR